MLIHGETRRQPVFSSLSIPLAYIPTWKKHLLLLFQYKRERSIEGDLFDDIDQSESYDDGHPPLHVYINRWLDLRTRPFVG